MSEPRLRNVIPVDLPPEQLERRIRDIGSAFGRSIDWVKNHHPRTERNLVLFNLLAAPLPYVELCAQNISGPIAAVALCTRTLFELDIRVRHVLMSESNLRAWIAEAASDRIDVLKGLRELVDPSDPRVSLMNQEIARTNALMGKHGLEGTGKEYKRIDILAISVGLQRDYKALFKLFSKLVHPTSYLVNSTPVMDDAQTRTVLLAHLQLFALDLLKRISDEFGVPSELTGPTGDTQPRG